MLGYTPPTGPEADTPPGQTPPWADTPPVQCMLGYGQQAGGTHPTGMHSCYFYMLDNHSVKFECKSHGALKLMKI